MTAKNVIIDGGRLTGIIDVDGVCFGDPLFTVALTRMALLSRDYATDYIDGWCARLELSTAQRAALDLYTALFCAGFLAEFGQRHSRASPLPADKGQIARLLAIWHISRRRSEEVTHRWPAMCRGSWGNLTIGLCSHGHGDGGMAMGTGAAAGAMAAWMTMATLFGGIAASTLPNEEAPFMVVEQRTTIDLASYRWENRLVLIFSPTTDDPLLQEQLHTFAWRDPEVVDRDLILGYFPIDEMGSFGGEPTAASAGAALREEFGIAADSFTILLIGKDGGVKMRSATPLTADMIFATIDSMPMRQQETR